MPSDRGARLGPPRPTRGRDAPLHAAYGETDALSALNTVVVAAVGARRAATILRKVVRDLAAPALIDASKNRPFSSLEHETLTVPVSFGWLREPAVSGSRAMPDSDRARRHGPALASARIVVGIDGSATSARALEWAIEAGRMHRSSIEAVHAWDTFSSEVEAFGTVVFDPATSIGVARAMMDAVLGAIYPGNSRAPLYGTVSLDRIAKGILRASEGADLVVVGSQGLGGLKDQELGSVTLQVVRHARCPVVVVRPASRAPRRRRRKRKEAATPA